jgi:hypothetical protein
MTVFTHAPEARGNQIATTVADRLAIDFVDQPRLERRFAERMRISETVARRMLLGQPSLIDRWVICGDRFQRCLTREVVELASKGDVLIQTPHVAAAVRRVRHVACVYVFAVEAPCDPCASSAPRSLSERNGNQAKSQMAAAPVSPPHTRESRIL